MEKRQDVVRFDNSKITGIFRPEVVHCNYNVGALGLGLGHSGRGAFRQRGIPTIIQSNDALKVSHKNTRQKSVLTLTPNQGF